MISLEESNKQQTNSTQKIKPEKKELKLGPK
jgi:hypothetical protein